MMNEIVSEFYGYIKRRPWITIILGVLFTKFLLDKVVSDLIITVIGYYWTGILTIILIFVFALLVIVGFYDDHRKRKDLKTPPNIQPLDKKYKGLVVFISLISKRPGAPTPEEIREKIDSIKDRKDESEMGKLYEIMGIGQTIKAVNYHFGELESCWLLHTGASRKSRELVEHFIKKFGGGTVKVKPIEIENINKIEEVSKKVDDIYRKDLEERGLMQSDVIVDVTGGTSLVGAAFTLACTPKDRDMEYVEQETRTLMEIKENIQEVIHRG